MNRAILIVICDFLVSAMLSMMTGMVPAGFSGAPTGHGGSGAIGAPGVGLDAPTTSLLLSELRIREAQLEELRRRLREAQRKNYSEEREKELDRLTRELAEAKQRGSELEKMLASRRETTGKLSAAELKAKLQEAETRNRYAELRLEDAKAAAQELRAESRENSEAVRRARAESAVIQERLKEADRRISEAKGELRRSESELKQRDEELRRAGGELEKKRTELAVREQALANLQNALAAAIKRTEMSETEGKKLERNLSFVRGRLSTTERSLAETRGVAERTRKIAATRELELNETQRQLADARMMLKNAVGELSKTREEFEKTRRNADDAAKKMIEAKAREEAATAQLRITGKLLEAAEKRMRSDVLQKYADAAVHFNVDLVENRLVVDQKAGGSYYLPLVELGGKKVLISDFHTLAGDAVAPLNFVKVSKLDYTASAPGDAKNTRLTAPIMLAPQDLRAAAIEAELPGRTPLKALSPDELRTRGVDELYLFKRNGSGKDSAALGDRCSLDFSTGGKVLYIRNGRGGSELKAEPGDVVLTREGDFVGVVVASESAVFNRRLDAKCYLFPVDFTWENAPRIPVVRKAGQNYYDDFAKAMRLYAEKVRSLTDR